MSYNNRPNGQPAKPANLSQKYSVLGPLAAGSTKPGSLDPDLYFFHHTAVQSITMVG